MTGWCPTGKPANEELVKSTGGKQGWDVAAASAADLTVAPFQKVENYPEWKTKYATPALQQYFANKIDPGPARHAAGRRMGSRF